MRSKNISCMSSEQLFHFMSKVTLMLKVHLNSNIFRSLCKSPHPKQTYVTTCHRIRLFLCRASHVNLAELAVIWTHDRDVRGMDLFSILRHKLLCIPVFKEILHCKAVCDVKSRIDPCLSHHGRGSKLLLVLITLRVLPGR